VLANQFILAGLARHRPDDGILSEESADTPERLRKGRVWVIDPLDGTREYTEGRDDFAVHVALVERGMPTAGAIALPAQGLVLRTDRPPTDRQERSVLKIMVSRTRPPTEASGVAKALGAELVQMGSAGAKAAQVLTGAADAYLHSGGQHEWDNCAPAAVAIAAGPSATRLDGAPVVYHLDSPRTPDLLICRPELFEPIQQALRALPPGTTDPSEIE